MERIGYSGHSRVPPPQAAQQVASLSQLEKLIRESNRKALLAASQTGDDLAAAA